MPVHRPLAARFWDKVVQGDTPNDCWEWVDSVKSQLLAGSTDFYHYRRHNDAVFKW